MPDPEARRIAYFSMEIALAPGMPTYSGGLGVLAGDTIRAAVDLMIPMVAVSLVHRQGYFYQRLDASGWQTEEPVHWPVDDFLEELPQRVQVEVGGRPVQLRAWRFTVSGETGYTVPVVLLDADLSENHPDDRQLTHYLYGGDMRYRLCQEVVLGIGGVRMLRSLGYAEVRQFHMNEGHSALLTLELLDEQRRGSGRTAIIQEDVAAVQAQCVFTTHTPVPAGHDQFPMELVNQVLRRPDVNERRDLFCCDGTLNMTYLALNLSHYINGVAKRHGLLSQQMFAHYMVDAITNGVHVPTWTSHAFQRLFDRHIPGWKADNFSLRYAISIPDEEIWSAHVEQKAKLIQYVNRETNAGLDADAFTLGFARRMTAYKRPALLLEDTARVKQIARDVGPIQLVYAGRAHPQDQEGKEMIRRIFQARDALRPEVPLAFVDNYDLLAAQLLTAGVDTWLNTPEPPLEASGTSGMKAALNGVPSLSILDGWWIEGCMEGVTGWSIGESAGDPQLRHNGQRDVESLYDKLERVVVPTFYQDRDTFLSVMRHAIALNGSFFNTQRMLQQYVAKAYFH